MKIVYLHQYFKTPDQAGGTRSYEMAKRLVSMGHEVHMITSSSDEPSATTREGWNELEIDGIRVHSIAIPYNNRMSFGARVKAFLKFSLSSARKAMSIKADVVFATSTPLTIAIPGYLASRKSQCPMVFEVRDLWPDVPIAMGILKNPITIMAAKFLEKFAYRASEQVVALSEGMATGVRKSGFPAEKISLIPNSCDLDLFNPEKIPFGEFRAQHPEIPPGPIILYPGTLGKVNGVSYLVDLAHEALKAQSDISFVVIGDGAEKNEIESLAKQNGTLGKNFFVYPPIPKRELTKAFRDSSMIVSLVIDNPALEANSANKFFDGLAAGKAIAINHGGWQKDLIQTNDLGLALSRDIKIAFQDIASFFKNPAHVTQCGIRARILAGDAFSRDILARKLERVLSTAAMRTTLTAEHEDIFTPTPKISEYSKTSITAQEIIAIRHKLKLSQEAFAHHLQTPPNTLRDWENNRSKPNAQAILLIRLIEQFPDMVERLETV